MDNRFSLLVSLVALLVGVHVVNMLTNGWLLQFGIQPGNPATLPYIFTAPFIHGDWAHLTNNLFGLLVFSLLCMLRGRSFYLMSSLFIIVVTGVLVWIFGRPATHVGASGWIFGLWSLSIAMAWFQRKFVNILIAVFVLFFYGGMVFGVLPRDPHVSFESHLFGALAGIACAYVMTRPKHRRQIRRS
ncbi:rhomboid family intramembrane serine protease [Teredinibacter turnerae]|uniref:rhomboid family intramembrane serine protease n=1 Tax=Teredinibacter turnerae TaxID=2426 RepID=UPI0005F82030|nr:rhomboid family intramembrane serine protease [Teredinibacter turnerae]